MHEGDAKSMGGYSLRKLGISSWARTEKNVMLGSNRIPPSSCLKTETLATKCLRSMPDFLSGKLTLTAHPEQMEGQTQKTRSGAGVSTRRRGAG